MARTVRTKVYKFEELTPDAQEKAIQQFSEINVDYGWWDNTYEDANNIGLKITGFDLYREGYCKGEFISGAEECAHKIEKEHGEQCETYKTAQHYLTTRDNIIAATPKDEHGEYVDEYALEQELDEADSDFLKSLLEDYRVILQEEYDYLTSEEAIKETIIANEYEFTKDGKQFHVK